MLQCETSVRKVTILMSLGLVAKLYEDNFRDAARQGERQTRNIELSEKRVKDEEKRSLVDASILTGATDANPVNKTMQFSVRFRQLHESSQFGVSE